MAQESTATEMEKWSSMVEQFKASAEKHKVRAQNLESENTQLRAALDRTKGGA